MIKYLKSRATGGTRAVLTLIVASMLGSLYVAPAFAEKNNHARQDNRHSDQRRRQWSGDREHYPYRPVYRQPYAYSQPVYVPSPLYYEPRQSPGISFFFPLDLRR